ncbi:MAG: hypothetical protein AB8I56_18840, partial [Anaerolineales bacterium]
MLTIIILIITTRILTGNGACVKALLHDHRTNLIPLAGPDPLPPLSPGLVRFNAEDSFLSFSVIKLEQLCYTVIMSDIERLSLLTQ